MPLGLTAPGLEYGHSVDPDHHLTHPLRDTCWISLSIPGRAVASMPIPKSWAFVVYRFFGNRISFSKISIQRMHHQCGSVCVSYVIGFASRVSLRSILNSRTRGIAGRSGPPPRTVDYPRFRRHPIPSHATMHTASPTCYINWTGLPTARSVASLVKPVSQTPYQAKPDRNGHRSPCRRRRRRRR